VLFLKGEGASNAALAFLAEVLEADEDGKKQDQRKQEAERKRGGLLIKRQGRSL
jgi:hypothetical protein